MPYISEKDRSEVLFFLSPQYPDKAVLINREYLGELVGDACRNGGDLQYILAVALDQYLQKHGLRYQQLQDIMGALSGALAEFQRVVVNPYEQIKIHENGKVYSNNYETKGY